MARRMGTATTTLLASLLATGNAQGQPGSAAPVADRSTHVTTLGEVRALKPEDDIPLDLYRFKHPVHAEPNTFNRAWREPPSLQEVGIRGGYVMMGINYAIAKTAQGLHTLTRAPDPIQPAKAREPPELDADQHRRAMKFCEVEQGCPGVSED